MFMWTICWEEEFDLGARCRTHEVQRETVDTEGKL